MTTPIIDVSPGWEAVERDEGVQLVDTHLEARPDPDAVQLTADDVSVMLDLTARASQPVLPRTVELGTYLASSGTAPLVAMAGVRLHPAGWFEISAVCTDVAHGDQGSPPG